MSQIASKVRCYPSNTLLSRCPAMPWITHWRPCCALRDAIANAPSAARNTSKPRAMLTATSL